MSPDVLRFSFKGTGQDLIYRLGPVPNSLSHYNAGLPAARNHRGHSFPERGLLVRNSRKASLAGIRGDSACIRQ
jgi:hypothetical protein